MNEHTFSRDVNYLYSIHGCPDEFFAGFSPDGTQVLIVMFYRKMVAMFFDRTGNLTKVQRSPFEQFEPDFLLREMGLTQGLIKVKRFFLQDEYIGIRDFPEALERILRDPSKHTEDEVAAARRALKRWREEGVFRLCIGPNNDRWLTHDGSIESS